MREEVGYGPRDAYEALAGYGDGVRSRLAMAAEYLANMSESESTIPGDDTREAVYALSRMLAGCAADVGRAAEALRGAGASATA